MWPQTNKHRPFNFRSVFFLSFGSAGNPRNSGWCCYWYMTTLIPSHVVGGGTTISPLYPPCVPLSFLLSFCVTCKYNFPQTNTGHSMLVSLWTSLTHLPFFAKVLLSLQYTSPIVLHNGIFGALFLERWLLFFMKSWDSHSPSALCNHSSFLKVGKYGFLLLKLLCLFSFLTSGSLECSGDTNWGAWREPLSRVYNWLLLFQYPTQIPFPAAVLTSPGDPQLNRTRFHLVMVWII